MEEDYLKNVSESQEPSIIVDGKKYSNLEAEIVRSQLPEYNEETGEIIGQMRDNDIFKGNMVATSRILGGKRSAEDRKKLLNYAIRMNKEAIDYMHHYDKKTSRANINPFIPGGKK